VLLVSKSLGEVNATLALIRTLLLGAGLLTLADTLPIARTSGLFTGGFLVDGPRRTPGEVAGFLTTD